MVKNVCGIIPGVVKSPPGLQIEPPDLQHET